MTPSKPALFSWLGRCGPGLLVMAAGLAATVVAYLPALDGGFYFDDVPNIIDPPAIHWQEVSWAGVRSVASSAMIPGRLIANLTLAANHAHGGLDPVGYHVFNLLIHLLVGIVLAWVCVEYLGREGPNAGARSGVVASAVATLFLLHPLNTQAVSYVVQRMTSMATLFVLTAFGLYLVARRGQRPPRLQLVLYAAAAGSWVCGILCKEIALALPAVIILYEITFNRVEWSDRICAAMRSRSGRLAVGAAVLAAAVTVASVASVWVPWSTLASFDTLPGRDFSWPERVLTQPRAQLFYLSLVLWPAPSRLNLDHDFSPSRSLLEPPATLPAWIIIIALVGAALRLAVVRPRLGFPLLAYVCFQLIESGPVNLELVFEHRMYLPMTALALFVGAAILDLPPRRRAVVLAAIPVAAIALGMATYQRNLVWGDSVAFAFDCARKSPNKFRAQYNLGTELGKIGRIEEAEAPFLRALDLEPEDSQTNNQLGNIAFLRGDLEAALGYYSEAVEHDHGNAQALYNLALVHERLGNQEAALTYYRRFVPAARRFPYLADTARQVQERIAGLDAETSGP